MAHPPRLPPSYVREEVLLELLVRTVYRSVLKLIPMQLKDQVLGRLLLLRIDLHGILLLFLGRYVLRHLESEDRMLLRQDLDLVRLRDNFKGVFRVLHNYTLRPDPAGASASAHVYHRTMIVCARKLRRCNRRDWPSRS